MGGRDNVVEAGAASSRLWLKLRDPAAIDAAALEQLGTKAVATPGKNVVHLIIGAEAEPIAASLLQ
jgi:PTS system N-acetylglucosamine-specific IIC component